MQELSYHNIEDILLIEEFLRENPDADLDTLESHFFLDRDTLEKYYELSLDIIKDNIDIYDEHDLINYYLNK